MTTLVLAIRFGATAAFEPSSAQKELYRNLRKFLVGAQFGQSPLRIRTLPVPSEHSVPEKEFSKLIIREVQHENPKSLLIDVGGPDERDPARYNIMMGLILALRTLTLDHPALEISVAFPTSLNERHFYIPTLKRTTTNGKVRILFATGQVWGTVPRGGRAPADVRGWYAKARTDVLDLLVRKLIRRTGYYELPESGQKLLHYYDGQKAHDEIYSIVLNVLRSERPSSLIILDSRRSTWFRAPVLAAINECGLIAQARDLMENDDISAADSDALVLLPIIRTAQSLTKLFELGPRTWHVKRPRIWSLLSTKGSAPRHGDRWDPAMPDGSLVESSYALQVPSTAQWLLDHRLQSAVIPINPETESLAGKFGSDAMWAMIMEAGLEIENPIPSHRKSLGYVPRFGRIAETNGALIAAKLEATLEQTFGNHMAPQIAFLCPLEPNAMQVARSLRALAGHDTIHVDRDIITLFRKHRTQSEVLRAINLRKGKKRAQLAKVFEALSAQLSYLSSLCTKLPRHDQPHIVLLDEFGYSGRTLNGLYRLASAYNLRILCCVSLADLSVQNMEKLPAQGISLYSFSYPVQEISAE